MSLWHHTRNEVAGAWRSLRYDLGRRTDDDVAVPAPGPGPDVTSTGMSTFAGAAAAEPHRPLHAGGQIRSPRRVLAMSAFGVLAVVGTAGAYFAVVGGLGVVLEPGPAPQPYPLAAAAPTDGPDGRADSVSGLGRGPAAAPGRTTAATAPDVALTVPPPPAQAPVAAPTRAPEDLPLPGTPGDDCDCLTPPVPTPTAPPSPSPVTPSAEPSPSPSEPEETPTDGPTGWPDTEPSGAGGGY